MVLAPETSSTWGGVVARNLARETKWDESDDVGALFSPRQSKDVETSELPNAAIEQSTIPSAAHIPPRVPLLRVRNSTPIIPRSIEILQQWEGVVSEVSDDEFTADLNSLTEEDAQPLTGEISFDEVSDADRPLIQGGAVFYWVIGYDKSPAGQVRRISEIRFRRSPEWTGRKLDAIREEAREWFQQVIQNEAK